jgi:hypothetical protein
MVGENQYALNLLTIDPRRDGREFEIEITRGVEFSACIVDAETSLPVPNAQVTLTKTGQSDEPGSFGLARSDQEGCFRFVHVLPGEYLVSVVAAAFEPAVIRIDLCNEGFPAHVMLRRGRPLTVEFSKLAVERPLVTWQVVDSLGIMLTYGRTRLDEEGRFRLMAPPPGAYRLEIQRSRHMPFITKKFAITEGALAPILIDLGTQRSLKGVLRDGSGTAVGGVQLFIENGGSTRTSDNGEFHFASVAVGSRRVWIRTSQGAVWLDDVVVRRFEGQNYVELSLGRRGSVSGTLVGVEDLDQLLVVLSFPGGARVADARVDPSSGAFWIPYVPQGDYKLEVLGSEYERASKRVTLGVGEAAVVAPIHVRRLVNVMIRVITPSGTPARLSVTMVTSAGLLQRDVKLDKQGGGVLERIPPGTHRVVVSADGFTSSTTSIVARRGATELQTIILE